MKDFVMHAGKKREEKENKKKKKKKEKSLKLFPVYFSFLHDR